MQAVIDHYEKAGDLQREGKLNEAIQEYRAGYELLKDSSEPDAKSRINYFAAKLAYLLWGQARFEEAREYFEIQGQEMPKPPKTGLSFNKALKAMQKCGLLTEFTKKDFKTACEDCDIDPADADGKFELSYLYMSYYKSETRTISARAVSDGFLHYDWRYGQDTDDIIADICQVIGAPILKQIAFHERPLGYAVGTRTIMTVERENKNLEEIEADSVTTIFAFVNLVLQEQGDKRRFVGVATDGDWTAHYLLDAATYKKLCCGKAIALPEDESGVVGVDVERWLKSA